MVLDRPDVEERDDRRVRTSASSSIAESRRVREPAVAESFEVLRLGLSDSREILLSCYDHLSLRSSSLKEGFIAYESVCGV
jgi:hypothetical protein